MSESSIYVYSQSTEDNYQVSTKVHQGRNHIVIPVVMMMEGVHSGSHGALLHTITDLGKFPESWNGIPVVVPNHPKDAEGNYISANSPDIIDNKTIGRVYNTHVEGLKLMAEVWLDEEKSAQISPDVLSAVNERQKVEVSVGVFTEDEETVGVYNDEPYTNIARNHRPDHLALLPGGTGACSIEDGCGLGANEKKGGKNVIKKEDLFTKLQTLKKEDQTVISITDNTSEGLMQTLDEVRGLVYSLDTQDESYYLEEVYDSYVIYRKNSRGSGEQIFKRNYQKNASTGEMEFAGQPVEVEKQVTYVNVNNFNINRPFHRANSKKEGLNMENGKCTPCVLKKVDALIANSLTAYTEEDREWLQDLEEKQLDRMTPKIPEAPVVNEKKEEHPAPVNQVQVLSEEDKENIAWAKAERLARKNAMISSIQANTSKELWPDATLNAMNEDTLKRLASSVEKKAEPIVDYSLNGGFNRTINDNAEDDEVLPPTGILIK